MSEKPLWNPYHWPGFFRLVREVLRWPRKRQLELLAELRRWREAQP